MNFENFSKLANIRAFRFVVVTLLEATALIVLAIILPGIEIDSITTAIIVVFVVALVNALIWPLLSYIALPLTVYTLGLGTLVINALIIIVVTELVNGIYLDNFFSAVGIAFALTIGNMTATHILSFDDDEVYYQNVLKKRVYKKFEEIPDKPGIIFLEIDGLSAPTIKKAIKKGFMPNLAKWLKKTHSLVEWETDLSSQTGASQAGILHGSNKNIPAFRWVEKKLDNRILTSTGKDDAPEIESRHSNGRGLLAKKGGSRTNLFSGDAEDSLFTFSQLSSISKVYNKSLYAFFANPYNFTRSFMLTLWDVFLEIKSRKRQEKKNIIPRLGKEKRGGVYPLVRASATVFLRDITAHAIIGDVYAGQKDAVYSTFSGYDEVAHHSGVEDKDAFYVLKNIDQTFARIKKYAETSRRKYEFVVLSDHGQSKGSTFKQRYGYTLEGLITGLINPNSKVKSKLETSEGWGSLNLMLSSITQDKDALSGKALRTVVRKNMYGDSVVMGPDHKDTKKR